jgi:hypothetical protein
MLSRKYRRTLAFTLVLSAGALTLPPAEASPGRSGPPQAGPAVQTQAFMRSLIETVKNLWGLVKDAPPPGHRGPGPYSQGDEGPSVCPHGGHPNP